MLKAIFYHAGCPVCVDAEQVVLDYLDQSKIDLEIVHLGTERNRLEEAEKAGIQSVPALVIGGNVYHINFGASLEDVKNG
ncbi:thioredoxin family protein [Brevibacillus sp. HB1.2]|uniref:glutaredoxin family protein n=1 Tax=Brevibacillus TaxID=55080 RepID=UPI000382A2AD|nr:MULTISPECIES: thioredoxin family protein [unclassified Brevibacillus]ATF13383.1 thioredoxin family protein [Brevibacillus brevis X23]MDC0759452.1 thioredoxin family protein [Brevibacillus sp. AG]NRS15456.1 thioredoxin family protein [Brevibacillus sp. HB1.4B]NTU18886.1 thioredoxin family protein [Brevibacillus sp. HB1.2]NTU29695.1 thioredoxin family protein [Brevibacillus sp. HB1.1]